MRYPRVLARKHRACFKTQEPLRTPETRLGPSTHRYRPRIGRERLAVRKAAIKRTQKENSCATGTARRFFSAYRAMRTVWSVLTPWMRWRGWLEPSGAPLQKVRPRCVKAVSTPLCGAGSYRLHHRSAEGVPRGDGTAQFVDLATGSRSSSAAQRRVSTVAGPNRRGSRRRRHHHRISVSVRTIRSTRKQRDSNSQIRSLMMIGTNIGGITTRAARTSQTTGSPAPLRLSCPSAPSAPAPSASAPARAARRSLQAGLR